MVTKFKATVPVLEQQNIAENIFSIWIESKDIAMASKPGQFIDVYIADTGKLLPRPISICEIDKENNKIRMVYRVTGLNTGTEIMSKLKTGDTLDVLGPLGNGFPLRDGKAILIGGGIGVPPMLQLAKELKGAKDIVVGYRDDIFLREELQEEGNLYIATEDGSVGTKGNVLDAIRQNLLSAEVIYACGPTPMLKAVKSYAMEHNILCYISLEEKMACGIGACLACVCKTKEINEYSNMNSARICKDGPIFLSTEVEL